MLDHLRWLHISDLHFREEGASTDPFSQQVASHAILKHFGENDDSCPSFHFVLVTGDIAFAGKAQEYAVAHSFFEELSAVLSVPKDRFFFVPGNHDVDRSINTLAYHGACVECRSQPGVDSVLCSSDFNSLLARQGEFWSFVESFAAGQSREFTPSRLAYQSHLIIEGLKVKIFGLNSSWLCGRDSEDGNLVIGERQVIELFGFSDDADPNLSLGLSHHPLEWLCEWDQVACRNSLLPNIDFFHRGHLHQPEVYLSSVPSSPCLSVAAGSGHATRFYRNSFNVISINLGLGKCAVTPFEFESEHIRYTQRDSTKAEISISAKIPGDLRTLYEAISQVVGDLDELSGYLTCLLTCHFEEVPLEISGSVAMMAPNPATSTQVSVVTEFMSLRNILRLYEEKIPLVDRILENRSKVQSFVEYLRNLSTENTEISQRLKQRNTDAICIIGLKPVEKRTYTIVFLEELRNGDEWIDLEIQARRYIGNQTSSIARAAQSFLIEALARSDEPVKRQEGVKLARKLLEEPDATAEEYLVAAIAAERVRDDAYSSELGKEMIHKWPENELIMEYVSGLALRLGSRELRELVAVARKIGDGCE